MSKSTKWFLLIFSMLVVVGVVFTFLFYSAIRSVSDGSKEVVTVGRGAKLALVELVGEIRSSEDIIRQLKKYREDSSIKGILLRIDSPGGAVVPSQEMYEEVRKTRDVKPVVVSMGSLAASGGYYVAVGATKLVANRGTLTGSIGVIAEFLQVQEAMKKLGVDIKTVKSGKLKDAGTPVRNMSAEAEKYFQWLLDDVHRQFVTVVEQERKLKHSDALALSDGRVYTGEQAIELGLVDTLGTYEDAVRIAAELSGIDGDPAIVKEREKKKFFDRMFGDVGESISDIKEAILQKPIMSYRFIGPF